jgi:hypothetical protein
MMPENGRFEALKPAHNLVIGEIFQDPDAPHNDVAWSTEHRRQQEKKKEALLF